MNKSIGLAIGAVLVAGTASAEGQLALYNWGDYINPLILQNFTEETGIAVTLDTYSSNEEMLAKIQAGATGYDIIFPSLHMADIMVKLGLIAEAHPNEMPGFENIDPLTLRAAEDPNADFCLPYAFGTVGIFYNEDITGPINGWEDFFNIPANTGGKITILDDMREVMAVGLIMTGSSVNSEDPGEIQAAMEYILEHKPDVSAFTYESPALLLSEDIAAAHFFVGGHVYFVDHPNIKYVIPEEGGTLYQENMCILNTAPHMDEALQFMEFYLRPENAALNVAQQFNGTANIPARDLVPDYIKENPNITLAPETLERVQTFVDLGAALRVYDRVWNTIRTAQ